MPEASDVQFSYFNDFNSKKEGIALTHPLVFPPETDSVWQNINDQIEVYSQKVRKEFNKKDGIKEDVTRYHWLESSHYIIDGTTHLINMILNRQAEGKPIKTLVFLDKAGRLAAHVFRKLWSTLEEQSKIPQGTVIPKIKFINVGKEKRDKYKDLRSQELLASFFPSKDLAGEGILVVDEIINSGKSVQNAARLLHQQYSASAEAVAQFKGELVRWYSNDSAKGVIDPIIDNTTYRLMRKITDLDFEALLHVFSESESEQDFIEKIKVSDLFLKLHNLANESQFYREGVDLKSVYAYIKTAGGLFAAPQKRKKSRREHLIYRYSLTKLAELAADHIQLEK